MTLKKENKNSLVKRNFVGNFLLLSVFLFVAVSIFFVSPVSAVSGIMNGKKITGDTDNFLFWLQTYDPTIAPYFTDRLFVDKSGNVGIGTTAPTSKLQVPTGVISGLGGTFTGLGSAGNVVVMADNTGGLYSTSTASFISGNSLDLWKGTKNGNIWNGDAGVGNVGIGTTNPAYGKLQIAGGNLIVNRPANKVDNAGISELSTFEINNSFVAGQAGYVRFYYPTYNNFLIGADYDGNVGGAQPNIQIGRTGNPYLTVVNNGANLGSVGIGTTNPSYKLDVNGEGRFSGKLRSSNDDGLLKQVITYDDYITDITYSGKTLKIADHNNLFYALNSRFITTTVDDSGYPTTPGTRRILTYSLRTDESAGGVTYPLGTMYFKFWSSAVPQSVSVRVRNQSGAWYGPWSSSTNISEVGFGLYKINIPGSFNYARDFEITLTSSGVNPNLNSVEYYLNTPEGADVAPQLQKTGGHLYGSLNFKNSGVIVNSISTGGISYFNAGNVGIGTTNPTSKLQVPTGVISGLGGTFTGLGSAGNVVVMADNTGGLYSTSTASFISANSLDLWKGTKNGNIWNGDAGVGNVGVGTTNPLYLLDLYTSSSNSNVINISNGTTSLRFGIGTITPNATSITSSGRLDFNAPGSQMFFTSSQTFFQSPFILARSGDATSVATQKDAYAMQFQNSLWNGSSATMNVSSIKSIASTNISLGSRLAFLPQNGIDGTQVERMSILSDGNVGIGATNPTSKLQAPTGVISGLGGTFTGLGSAGNVVVMADNTGGLYSTSSASFISGNSLDLWKGTKNGNIYNGDAGVGNVGIGVTNPAAKLAIQGSGTYNSTNWGTTSDVAIRSSEMSDSAYHSILQLVSIRQSLTTGNAANGYLGFSTIDDSNAQGMLDAGRIAIVNESGSERNSATALSFWTNAAGGGVDTTPSTEKVRITSAGNVGVGTTNPGEKLEINSGNILVNNQTTSPYITLKGNSLTAPYPSLSVKNESNVTMAQWINSMDGGVGASLFDTAYAGGYFRIRAGINGSIGITANFANSGAVSLGGLSALTNPFLFIAATSGNVGIGATAPTSKLQVPTGVISGLGGTFTGLGSAGNVVVMADNTGGLYSTSTASFISGNSLDLWKGTKNGNIWNGDAGVGNVGIGTATPVYQLDINGTFKATASSSSIILDASGNISIGI